MIVSFDALRKLVCFSVCCNFLFYVRRCVALRRAGPFSFIAQKMKFSIKNFFSNCQQICSFVRIWSHLPKISLMENLIFCAVFLLILLHYCIIMFMCFMRRVYHTSLLRLKNISRKYVMLDEYLWELDDETDAYIKCIIM